MFLPSSGAVPEPVKFRPRADFRDSRAAGLAFLLGPVSTDGPQFTRSIAKLHPLSGGLIQVVEGLGAGRNGVFISACPARAVRPRLFFWGWSQQQLDPPLAAVSGIELWGLTLATAAAEMLAAGAFASSGREVVAGCAWGRSFSPAAGCGGASRFYLEGGRRLGPEAAGCSADSRIQCLDGRLYSPEDFDNSAAKRPDGASPREPPAARRKALWRVRPRRGPANEAAS